jgi:hypothetical protein
MNKIKAAVKTSKVLSPIVKGVAKRGDWILAVLAFLGLTGTAALAVKATITAVKLCEEKEIKDGKEVVRTTWRLYIPAIGCFIVTTLSVMGLSWRSIKRAKELATVTGLYAMSQTDLKSIKAKAKEILGEKKEQEKLEDGVIKDELDRMTIPPESEIIKTGHGDKLFRERLTGQLIRTSPEWIEAVSEKVAAQFGKEVDGVVEVGYYLELLNIPSDCWVGNAVWEEVEMLECGYNKFEIDCREIKWMEVNGKQEMVGIISPPNPTGV